MSPERPNRHRRWLLAVGLVVFCFLGGFFHVSDADVGYHMRTAEHILAGHGVPTTNTFSHTTPEHPWLLHQAAGTLIFHAPYRLAGVPGLVAFKALVGVGLIMLVWAAARRLTGPESLWPFWAATLALVLARVRFFERSDLLSALLCAVLVWCETRFQGTRRWQLLGLPLLMTFWANLHAGVIYGVVLLAAWSGAEWLVWLWRRFRGVGSEMQPPFRELFVRPAGILLSVAAACVTVEMINPNGAKVLWFPISQFASPFWQSIIAEYFSPTWAANPLFYLTLGGLVVLQLLTLRRLELKWLLSTAAFAYLACGSQRSILFFIVPAMPHMALMLERLWPARAPVRTRWEPLLLPTAWAALALTIFVPDRTHRFGPGLYPGFYPMGIYDFLRREVPSQPLFNDMRFGGSMQWFVYPEFKPFIDGRGDAYSEVFWQEDYFPVLNVAPGWQDILARHDVGGALLSIHPGRETPLLASTLWADPDWALVAHDDHALLFLRRTEANAAVIAAHAFRHLWPGSPSFAALDDPATRAAATAEAVRAAERHPSGIHTRAALARALLVNDRFADAAALYDALIREGHDGDVFLRDHAFALLRAERLDEADAILTRMIREGKLPGYAAYLRHFIALERGQPAAAKELLRQAVAAEPENAAYREALSRLDAATPAP